MGAYSLGDAARICKVRPARLRYWKRTALLGAGLGAGGGERRDAFGFRDLVSIRSLVGLLRSGVPMRRIRRSMDVVRQRMPEVERPVELLRPWLPGSGRVVFEHDGALLEPDGQAVLDFAGRARAAAPHIAELARRRGDAAERAAFWFERGCDLDTDPARWADAVEAYCRAVEADPEFADAHCNLGALYLGRERSALARASFERALETDPDHLEANLNLAAVLEEEGDLATALVHYRRALEQEPCCPDTHVSVALIYEQLGRTRRARPHWRRYLQLDPRGAWAPLARRRLAGARLRGRPPPPRPR